MASMRDVKRRIKSVNSTKQITKAMNLVSAAKLQRARKKLDSTRPFFYETKRVIGNIVKNSKGISHPYLDQREVKSTLIILISGDRGLCGGYNANVSKEAFALFNEKKNVTMITSGSKGADFFKKHNVTIKKSYEGISEKPMYEDAVDIGRIALDMYSKGEVDEVYLTYTEFKSTISHEPKSIKILPVDTSGFADDSSAEPSQTLMTYEPSEEEVLDIIIPKYINTTIFGALVEAGACEQGAIMTAMDSATENASEMIHDLSLLYNRARQGAITQEITEIVGGANALD